MTDHPYVPAPSEVLDPAQLDQALLVLVVRSDGTAFTSVASGVDLTSLAAWLTEFAGLLATDTGCPDCATGSAHEHTEPALASPHDDPPK